jgi:hypothetical protein
MTKDTPDWGVEAFVGTGVGLEIVDTAPAPGADTAGLAFEAIGTDWKPTEGGLVRTWVWVAQPFKNNAETNRKAIFFI